MELTHTFTVPSSVEATWAHVMDLHAVGGCFPGATVTSFTGDDFTGTVKVKLGPIVLLYAGTGRFVARDDAAHVAVLEAKGKDSRGNGTAAATVTLSLTELDWGTQAQVVTDLSVTGKPAQFGRGVMQDVSDKLLNQFVACLEHQLAGDFDEPEPSGPTAGAVDGTQPAPDGHVTAAPSRAATPDSPPEGGVSGPRAGDAQGGALGQPSAHVAHARPARRPAGRMGPAARVGLGSAGRPAYRPHPGSADDAVDLGATVLPVLIKTYGPYLAAGLAGLLVGLAVRRRPRR